MQGLQRVMEQHAELPYPHRANVPLIRPQNRSNILTENTVAQALAAEDEQELQHHANFIQPLNRAQLIPSRLMIEEYFLLSSTDCVGFPHTQSNTGKGVS